MQSALKRISAKKQSSRKRPRWLYMHSTELVTAQTSCCRIQLSSHGINMSRHSNAVYLRRLYKCGFKISNGPLLDLCAVSTDNIRWEAHLSRPEVRVHPPRCLRKCGRKIRAWQRLWPALAPTHTRTTRRIVYSRTVRTPGTAHPKPKAPKRLHAQVEIMSSCGCTGCCGDSDRGAWLCPLSCPLTRQSCAASRRKKSRQPPWKIKCALYCYSPL